MIPGMWMPAGLISEPYSLTSKTAQGATNSNSPTLAFTDSTFAANRTFVALIACQDGSVADSSFSIGSVTIGGVTATIVAQSQNAGLNRSVAAAIAIATVPTGTNLNVTPTLTGFSGTMDSWLVGLLRVPAISTTALATSTGTDDSGAFDPTAACRFVAVAAADRASTLTGDTMNSGNGSRTTIFANTTSIIAYATSPGAGSTTYDFSDDTDVAVAAAFG